MSGDITIKFTGGKELERALVELGAQAPRVIAKGLKPPMQKVLDDMKALVPYDSESAYHLRDALALTPVRRATARRASMADSLSEIGIRLLKIGVWGKNGDWPRNYYWLVEEGTSRTAAKPYIRPAFDQNTAYMIGEFKRVTGDDIVRIWNQHAAKLRRAR